MQLIPFKKTFIFEVDMLYGMRLILIINGANSVENYVILETVTLDGMSLIFGMKMQLIPQKNHILEDILQNGMSLILNENAAFFVT